MTRERFHLSRNEFDQCHRHSDEWRLVQVEFHPQALTARSLTHAHVAAIRELPTNELLAVPPPDSEQFYWETSARIAPPARAWVPSALTVPSDLRLASISELGQEALDLRSAI